MKGRCLHYGGSMPYLPILDVTRSFIGVKEGEQEHVIRQKLKERILGLDEDPSIHHPAISRNSCL